MIGRTLTHYRITEKIGEGGVGVVYKAEDTKLGRTIALKFVRPDLLDDPRHKERFVLEAQASAAPTIRTCAPFTRLTRRTERRFS